MRRAILVTAVCRRPGRLLRIANTRDRKVRVTNYRRSYRAAGRACVCLRRSRSLARCLLSPSLGVCDDPGRAARSGAFFVSRSPHCGTRPSVETHA